jgi:nucleoside phosphorylase
MAMASAVDIARGVAWHLESDTEYIRMCQQATNPSAVPTVWGASSTPELFVDAFILLDGALRRACEVRMASKTRAPLIGSGGLLEARDSSKRVRDMAVLLAASLQPYLATGTDQNAEVQIHDNIQQCDRLVKFLAWKAQAAQSARKPSEVRASETPGTVNPQTPEHVVTSTGGMLSRMDAIELFRELDQELASVAEGPNHRADKFVAARDKITRVADKGSLLLPAIPLRFDLASIWIYHDRGILPEDHGAPIGPFLRRLFHYQAATKRILSILCDDSLWSLYRKQDLVAVPATSNPAVAAAVVDPKAQLELLERFDVAIVCALHTPELEKVLQTGQGWTRLPPNPSDPISYEQTTFKSKRGAAIRVVAGAPNLMGLSASSVLATKMIMRFRPRLVAMVGIAAGAKNDKQGYGDILAAEHTFDYGSGKIEETKQGHRFLPDPKPLDVDPRVLSRLHWWSAKRTELDAIRQSWPAKPPKTALEVHVGPLGSGAAVVSDASTVAGVLEHWRKLVGIEMEAYGVHRACRDTIQPAPLFLCLKSICDFGGIDKNDNWQDYAAFVSARFLHEFLTTDWEELFPD